MNEDHEIIQLVKDAYRFGKDLGYLDVSFEKFLEEARAGDVNDDSRKSRGKLGYYIIKAAEEKNLGFSVDWKWEAVDIVGFAGEVVPGLPVEFVKEDFIERFPFKGVVGGSAVVVTLKIAGKSTSLTVPKEYPMDLVNIINENLPEEYTDRTFVQYDTGGDSYGFLLIKKGLLSKFKDNKFIKFNTSSRIS